MNDGELNEILLRAFPERENDYRERKRTVNDGEEPSPVELVLYSLSPKIKIHLLRKNDAMIRKDRDAIESLFRLNQKEVGEVLLPLFGYLKQEGLLEEAEPYFKDRTKENRGD